MSRQTRISTKKSSSLPPSASFKAPPVIQPKAEKKPDAKLPEWKPGGGGATNPVQRLLDSKAAQAKLTIGQPNDKYEQEADAVAKQVVQRLHSPVSESPQPDTVQRESTEKVEDELQMKPTLQRVHAVGGQDAPSDIEAGINRAKGGGQPLDTGLQRSMGDAMGADFSAVRVHTDAQSDQLNQSIQAKAFTTGQDVFFRSGEYNPGSKGGQELIAHELTHVVQQNGSTVQKKVINQTNTSVDSIQRVQYDAELAKYYSEVLTGQQIDENNAVITATSNMAPGGGHTAIYIERLKDGSPDNKKVDLRYGMGDSGESSAKTSGYTDSSSGSSSSSGGHSATDEKGVTIRINDNMTARESHKKSWVVNASKVEPLLTKAQEIQSNQSKYSYTLLGVSPIKKKVLNCARFGEIILKAAGIDASAGKVFKLPSTLTKGGDVGYEKDQDYADREERQRQERERQKREAEKYKDLKPGKKKATFTQGKTVMGSRVESDPLNTQFTFAAVPANENEISLTPFAILIRTDLINLGRVKIDDVQPRGSYYVKIDQIVDTSGNIITS